MSWKKADTINWWMCQFLSGCFMFMRTEALKKNGTFLMSVSSFTPKTPICPGGFTGNSKRCFIRCWNLSYTCAGSYKDTSLTLHNLVSAIKYFRKWGWFLDEERKTINDTAIQSIKGVEYRNSLTNQVEVAPEIIRWVTSDIISFTISLVVMCYYLSLDEFNSNSACIILLAVVWLAEGNWPQNGNAWKALPGLCLFLCFLASIFLGCFIHKIFTPGYLRSKKTDVCGPPFDFRLRKAAGINSFFKFSEEKLCLFLCIARHRFPGVHGCSLCLFPAAYQFWRADRRVLPSIESLSFSPLEYFSYIQVGSWIDLHPVISHCMSSLACWFCWSKWWIKIK